MTKAIAVRREGDAFQARIFWRKAACLLDPTSPVIRVGFESGPKGFDDVWVEYAPGRGPRDQDGHLLLREHTQCKWHVSVNDYGHADLVDPNFINASSYSLLQRAHAAQLLYAKTGIGIRFKLLTNWRIGTADPLRPLIYQKSKTLRLDDLFATKTDASATGRIRKLWREHLGIDDAQLRLFARTLALATDSTSLDDHRDNLDILFENRGLRRVPVNESSFVYDDLPFQWLAQGRLEFDKQSFRQVCTREGLIAAQSKSSMVFGVKSFEHPFDRLEERCTSVLDLIPNFDNRTIHDHAAWSKVLYPELKTFLHAAARNNEQLRLVLDTHASLAFAAGSVLNIKSGRTIELEQRTINRQIWHASDSHTDTAWPTWAYDAEVINEKCTDIAVAVSLTHDVSAAVRTFITTSGLAVGTLLLARPSTGPGARSVTSGQHAFELADALSRRINEVRTKQASIHLFVAGPNAFTFFVGQRQPGLGKVTLYEFDFEGENGGSYTASLTLPV